MRLGIFQQDAGARDRFQAPTRSTQAELAAIDAILEDEGGLSIEQLLSVKDRLLRMVAADPAGQILHGPRIARVNLRLKAPSVVVTGPQKGAEREQWARHFVVAAKRLLDEPTYEILCREASCGSAVAGTLPSRTPKSALTREPGSPSGTCTQPLASTRSVSLCTTAPLAGPTATSILSSTIANGAGGAAGGSIFTCARTRSSSNCERGNVTSPPGPRHLPEPAAASASLPPPRNRPEPRRRDCS